jgi:hypothetical protein
LAWAVFIMFLKQLISCDLQVVLLHITILEQGLHIVLRT